MPGSLSIVYIRPWNYQPALKSSVIIEFLHWLYLQWSGVDPSGISWCPVNADLFTTTILKLLCFCLLFVRSFTFWYGASRAPYSNAPHHRSAAEMKAALPRGDNIIFSLYYETQEVTTAAACTVFHCPLASLFWLKLNGGKVNGSTVVWQKDNRVCCQNILSGFFTWWTFRWLHENLLNTFL